MAQRFEKVSDLAAAVEEDDALAAKLKADPAGALNQVAQGPLGTDVWIYRLTVSFLGSVIVLALVALAAITLNDSDAAVPDGIVALGSAAVGALAGLLAPSPKQ